MIQNDDILRCNYQKGSSEFIPPKYYPLCMGLGFQIAHPRSLCLHFSTKEKTVNKYLWKQTGGLVYSNKINKVSLDRQLGIPRYLEYFINIFSIILIIALDKFIWKNLVTILE